MQTLNSLQTTSLSVGCMSCLYICLYVKIEILQTTGLYMPLVPVRLERPIRLYLLPTGTKAALATGGLALRPPWPPARHRAAPPRPSGLPARACAAPRRPPRLPAMARRRGWLASFQAPAAAPSSLAATHSYLHRVQL
jgi:hypothetical protein